MPENIILIFVIMVLVYVAVQFAKGLIRGVILFVLVFVLGFSVYDIVFLKKPVSYEINRYKIDIAYFREVSSISSQAIADVNEIKSGNNMDANIDDLALLRNEAQELPHSEEINIISNNYLSAMDKVITAANAFKVAKGAEEQAASLESASKSLSISLKDIINPD
ncbi:MAG: hypothetical protein ABRQ27_11030 [Clostridiaceae bacterium]